MCVCVSVENFGPPNNLQTCYPIYTKFFPYIQDGRQISAIIVTEDYLCYKEPKSLYSFSFILIFNELFKFQTSDESQRWETGSSSLHCKDINL